MTPLILLAHADEALRRSLESVLSSAGNRVITAKGAAEALDEATQRPDAIIADLALAQPDDFALCRALRSNSAVSLATAIILIAEGVPRRTDHLAALRAGAWELRGEPLDTEELVLRLSVYVQGKQAAELVAMEGLLDRASGLYNATGIARRSEELLALTMRQQLPLACAVFKPAIEGDGVEGDRLAAAFKKVGRISDAIGRTGDAEFAVFAPATDVTAALGLVERMRGAIDVSLRAGFSAFTPTQRGRSADLLAQARSALEAA